MSRVNRLAITVVWNSPQVTVTRIKDTSPLNYYVSYKNLESKATKQIQSFTAQASLNLKANTRYEIKVQSFKVFDSSVAGSWSDSLTIKINESGESCKKQSQQFTNLHRSVSFFLSRPRGGSPIYVLVKVCL